MGKIKKLWHNPEVREVRHNLEDAAKAKAEQEAREYAEKKLFADERREAERREAERRENR